MMMLDSYDIVNVRRQEIQERRSAMLKQMLAHLLIGLGVGFMLGVMVGHLVTQ
jgi:hypothetical protein